jgi:hypothetical protein
MEAMAERMRSKSLLIMQLLEARGAPEGRGNNGELSRYESSASTDEVVDMGVGGGGGWGVGGVR